MTPRRMVRVRPRASADLVAIAVGIARTTSLTAAVRWRQRIAGVIRALADDADQWPEADEAADLGIDLRYRQFGRGRHTLRVLFTVDDSTQTVNVLRVRHAAQDRLSADDV